MLKKPTVILLLLTFFAAQAARSDVGTISNLGTKVQWGGEYRLRGLVGDNLNFDTSERTDIYSHRLILNGEMAPNDKIEAKFSLNLNQIIGDNGRRGALGLENAESDSSDIQILTAYANWHLGSSFALKFGRQELNWGHETLVSRNWDDQRPYSFDGLIFTYDSESLTFDAGALRVGDWSQDQSGGNTVDPDESAYFSRLSFKSFGKLFETADFLFLRLQSANFQDADLGINITGSSLNRLGFSLGGSRSGAFYQLDYVNLLGSYNDGLSAQAYMAHLKLGFKFGDRNPGSFYLIGHYDTGDDANTVDTVESYRPLYYNHHEYAGLMDLLAWGNLTYFGVGGTLTTGGVLEIKAQVLRFQLTDPSTGPSSISYLGYGNDQALISQAVQENSNGVSENQLGTELDLVFNREFASGAYLELILGVFLPDQYFESYGRSDEIYSLRLTTGFEF